MTEIALASPASSQNSRGEIPPSKEQRICNPRILLITHRIPYPPDKGDRIRSYHLLRMLSECGSVDLATLSDEVVSPSVCEHLQLWTSELVVEPIGRCRRWLRANISLLRGRSATEGLFFSAQLQRRIDELLARHSYDLIVVVCSSMVQYVAGSSRQSCGKLVDLIDVDSQKWFDYADASVGVKSWLYRLEGRRVRKLESRLPEAFDSIAVVSEDEADCYRSFQPSDKIKGIPNGVDLQRFAPNPAIPVKPDSCVFVGVLDYKPNAEAVEWFCDQVWPAVTKARPGATFTIVGRNPTSSVKQLARRPGVRLLADVPDVCPPLWEATISVAPLQIARGVQNKVLEAMAAAKPVVVSPQALVGIQAEAGKHLCVANSADEWARICLELFDAADLRQTLGLAAREFVETHHNWQNCLQPVADMLVAKS